MTRVSRWIGSILLILSLAACAPGAGSVAKPGYLGTSLETAVVIEAKNTIEGVRAEYAWIKQHYPGWSSGSQHLLNDKGRVYDVIEISRGSERRSIYFDISNWFGKWG
jgi:hypothetical protein